jgi:hypothetical protein
LKFRRATLPALRKDTLADPLDLATRVLGEAVSSNNIFTKFVVERQDTNKMQAFRLAA